MAPIKTLIATALSMAGAFALPAASEPPTPTQEDLTPSRIDKRQETFSSSTSGVDSAGFYYSVYNVNGADVGYTEYDSGRFQLGWQTNAEFLAGKGYQYGSPKTISWDGYFDASGVYTLAVYGWTAQPNVEWYVVESHGSNTYGNGDILGQINSDGGVYDVYSFDYPDAPPMFGVEGHHQYWSVRRETRTTGTVTLANHFNGWRSLGLDPGAIQFQMVTAEGFSGSGDLDFTVSSS